MKSIKKIALIGSVIMSLWATVWTTSASVNENVIPFTQKGIIFKLPPMPLDSIGDDTLKFPIKFNSNNPFDKQKYNSPLYLKQPSIFTNHVEYNPITGQFYITEKIGDISNNLPYAMDFDEYNNYQTQTAIRSYWKDKLEYQSGAGSGNPLLDKYLNPKLNVGIKGFEDIFGSDEISIVPSGAANITFGVNYYNIDNPSLPRQQRQNYSFNFDENIQMGVNGKIGNKMNVGINYNTEATFDFENKTKIEYVGEEDEIIQKIEAGNVTMPLENTLIPGSSTLFGLKTDLKFGRLTVTSVVSHQKGESQTIEVDGGAVLNDYEISASDYEQDKHFFIGHFFREGYEKALANLPVVLSTAQVTKIEVWVTNKTSDFENSRNIVAFLDLGETNRIHSSNIVSGPRNAPPSNESNNLYEQLNTTFSGVRDITQASSVLSGTFAEGEDFVKLENARKLDERDFTFNNELGYISLNFSLRSGEVLAVAYEYTINGEVYQVGEFSNGETQAPSSLILKLLKGPALTPDLPNWDLMMKNIYSLNTYSLSGEEFALKIMYNNDQTGTPINSIEEGNIKEQRLLSVFNLDNTDNQGTGSPDGFFDYMPGITVTPQNGRIIFPMLEPFGKYLEKKIGDPTVSDKYIFTELYDSTQYKAKQIASKNKFYLKGTYRSSSGSEIRLNAMNIPEGAVKVMQGGMELNENVDYTVDYNMGSVTILNEALLASGTPIKITVESEDMFGMKTKNLLGSHFNYQFSDNFNIGSTVMNLTEKPMQAKTNIGDEPISNTIWGLNTAYSTEVPLFTKMVDMLPFIETKEPSRIDFSGEFAQLIPGNPRIIDKAGVSYIDDFEDSQTYIDLKAPQAWVMASTPQHQPNLFPEANDLETWAYGYNRANLAWYTISEDLTSVTSALKPKHLTDEDLSNHLVRQVLEKEIFPNKETIGNFPTRISVFNLAFYPKERGPYNFDVEGEPGISAGLDENGQLNAPETRWGGMMRDLYINDFESSNIEFIEFWIMDPFVYDTTGTSTGGSLYFNLGDISEDILHDSRKSFENGIPYPNDPTKLDTTQWGLISRMQMLTQTFDTKEGAQLRQDAGYDGLLQSGENEVFAEYVSKIAEEYGQGSAVYNQVIADPSNDDFKFFLDDEYDQNEVGILDRYKRYNTTEGNSPPSNNNKTTSAVTFYPDMEDVNGDNTLDTYEGYYQYRVDIKPESMVVGQNYIVNKIEADVKNLPNKDESQKVTWYQFKIPIYEPDQVLGSIQGFKSIRFMRVFMTDFDDEMVLRFAKLQLVRGDWRKYQNTITEGGEGSIFPQLDNYGNLDVSIVNIEESGFKTPVNYVLPPEITRETSPYDPTITQLNEQALSLKTNELPDGESKAIYKTVNMDVRKYKRIKLFIHAEALPEMQDQLADGEVSAFIRLGSDFTQNYYEYEVPLKLTPEGVYISDDAAPMGEDRYIVWPTENEMDIEFEILQQAKQERNVDMREQGSNVSLTTPYIVYNEDDGRKITIMGNPNLSNVKTIMIGIRNPKAENNLAEDDGLPKSCEVWINELRLTDFNDDGGWAANSRINATFADFANVTVSGYMHTAGYGSIEKKVNERYKDETKEYDITSQIELGKFFPKDYGVSVPVYLGFSESYSDPEYNPLDPDIKLKTTLANENLTDEERKEIRYTAQTFIQRKSLNLTNVRIQGRKSKPNRGLKPKKNIKMPYHISNFSTSFAYSEIFTRTPVIEFDIEQNMMSSFAYNYSPNTKPVEPFKKVKFLNAKPLKIIKDFNFYYLPSRINFSTDFNRRYKTFKNRDITDAGLDLPTSYQKDFLWRRNYDVSYKLTKAIKLDFNAVNEARVDPQGWTERESLVDQLGWQTPQDTIFQNLSDLGNNTNYNHQIKANWKVPINKLPLLAWTTLTVDYTGTYDWRLGEGEQDIMATDSTPAYSIDFGNMIQNSGTLRLNGRLNFNKLYTGVKYLKEVDKRFTSKGRRPVKAKPKSVEFDKANVSVTKGAPKFINHKLRTEDIKKVIVVDEKGRIVRGDFEVIDKNRIKFTSDTTLKNVSFKIKGTRQQQESILLIASDYTLKSMMALQSISINYTENMGTLLNGYMPQTKYVGMEKYNNVLAPGWEFISGLQDRRIAYTASGYGWLTTDSLFNESINLTNSNDLRIRVALEPLNNVKLDLNLQRSTAYNQTQYGYSTTDGNYIEESKMIDGNFFISFNTIRTAFDKIDTADYKTEGYKNFRKYREEVGLRLGNNRQTLDPSYNMNMQADTFGIYYPEGYSSVSQEVMIPAFLSAYSGISPGEVSLATFLMIPLPDWRLQYDGLSNVPFLKEYLKKVTLKHGYQSTYTINNFQSNISYDYGLQEQMGVSREVYTNGLFIPEYEISGVMISEKFMPLFGVDITWTGTLSTRVEYQKARELFLSFSNNQIREMHSNALTIGAGYTFKEVPLNIKVNGENQHLQSDLNLRLDLTVRNDSEIFHRIQEDISELNTERTNFTLSSTADYNINSKVDVQLFYNHTLQKTNTAPKTTNIETGFKIRFALTP